jgi:CO/xanthine dehydrogenase Mo-binding subunit
MTYDTMPFAVDKQEARSPDAPTVFPGPADAAGSAGGGGGPKNVPQVGNVHGPQRKTVGDVEHGFSEADAVVEGEYFTQVQTHSALETHGFVVDWKPDEVTVYASTQGTASVRDEFAEVFKLPKSQVRVITEYMCGGFGAKFGAANEGVVAANLSRKTKLPVRLMLDRKQEHIVCNRPDSHQKLKIGAKKDGTRTAISLTSYGTAGLGTGAGTAGPATNMYKCPNLLTEQYDVFINAGPGAAFRAPGIINMDSSCEVRVSRDGSVELMSSVQDLGTGTKTLLAVVVAEEFGIPPADVVIRIGDTRYPIGPNSGGSVTAGSITPDVRNAAYQAKQKLFAAAAPKLGTSGDNLVMRGGKVIFKDDESRRTP